ncbi:flagellin, partial [Oceanospirillum sp. HFRX-1_2]
LKILNGDSPESGFQIQTGAYSGEQDTITTGNAELTALFGKMLDDEGITGLQISAMSEGNLDTYGTLGKIVGIYAALTGESIVSAAATALFGDATGLSVMTSEFGGKQGGGLQINVAELTKILEFEMTTSGSFAVASTASNQLQLLGITGVASTGFTDDQLNTIHAFATDTLLDAMSGLITQVDKQRAKLGAEQNGLTSVVRNNTTAVVNVSDSRSRIQDTDFAAETSELTRNQIIQQASTTILSQANQLPQTALTLLG